MRWNADELTPSGVTVACAKFTAWLLGELCIPPGWAIHFGDPDLFSRAVAAEHKQTAPASINLRLDFTCAAQLVHQLRDLSFHVQEPEDILLLCDKKFYTMPSIAMTSLKVFKASLLEPSKWKGNSSSRDDDCWIRKIHDSAQQISSQNQHLWMDTMEARPQFPHPPAFGLGVGNDIFEPRMTMEGGLHARQNLTDLFLMEGGACEICHHENSLSAYFADMMGNLKQVPTMFDILCNRRRDVISLELTCADSRTKIPHISLVNEVLESHIRYQADKDSPTKFQVASWQPSIPTDIVCHGDARAVPAYRDTGNTDEFVYDKVISQQLYPSQCSLSTSPTTKLCRSSAASDFYLPGLSRLFAMETSSRHRFSPRTLPLSAKMVLRSLPALSKTCVCWLADQTH
ncbi:hypothetical protein QC764_408050 [Podospora pseudoanserina]|uniref:Uncharacterized protein n=1 Tax=Podospora pseudoanserina TaxID=2609844 RepID=A0ABR0IB78_9PEZI|nr:hypothetical protein QC764_408050 [Podospora pseudoanserina]